jgi:deoxyribose-phosphate aldolase
MKEHIAEQTGFDQFPPSSRGLAQMIDISAVQAFHTEADIRSLAALALEKRFIAAHALPHFVPLLRSLIPVGGSTLVGAPVGFPSGGHTTTIKVAEARALIQAGADELDMMINLGRLKSGDLGYVRDEIKTVAEVIAPIPLKVILEVSRLTDDELRRGSESAVEGGAAFVKTGTGWTGEATTLTHIRIINFIVQGKCRIKASGGIRNLETVKAMLALGVTRFGINTGVALELMNECALAETS